MRVRECRFSWMARGYGVSRLDRTGLSIECMLARDVDGSTTQTGDERDPLHRPVRIAGCGARSTLEGDEKADYDRRQRPTLGYDAPAAGLSYRGRRLGFV